MKEAIELVFGQTGILQIRQRPLPSRIVSPSGLVQRAPIGQRPYTGGAAQPMSVKTYVKRGKSEAINTEVNCEAVLPPTMRFLATKNVEQQPLL